MMACGTKYQYSQLSEIDRALRVLKNAGFDYSSLPYQSLYKTRGMIMGKLGLRIPKPISLLKLLAGLSPGSVALFHDSESGWFTEARERPGTPPVYHHVSDDVAMSILRGEMTHELEATLMKPDEYLGE